MICYQLTLKVPLLLLLPPPPLPARATPPATARTAMTTQSQPLLLFPESIPFSAGMFISGVETDSGAFFVMPEFAIRTSPPARFTEVERRQDKEGYQYFHR
ncbi:MAG: hypothetical protein PH343_08710 [Nitrospira sp.]|nr:hypothetical protein [Nitrospira sp.]